MLVSRAGGGVVTVPGGEFVGIDLSACFADDSADFLGLFSDWRLSFHVDSVSTSSLLSSLSVPESLNITSGSFHPSSDTSFLHPFVLLWLLTSPFPQLPFSQTLFSSPPTPL